MFRKTNIVKLVNHKMSTPNVSKLNKSVLVHNCFNLK